MRRVLLPAVLILIAALIVVVEVQDKEPGSQLLFEIENRLALTERGQRRAAVRELVQEVPIRRPLDGSWPILTDEQLIGVAGRYILDFTGRRRFHVARVERTGSRAGDVVRYHLDDGAVVDFAYPRLIFFPDHLRTSEEILEWMRERESQ